MVSAKLLPQLGASCSVRRSANSYNYQYAKQNISPLVLKSLYLRSCYPPRHGDAQLAGMLSQQALRRLAFLESYSTYQWQRKRTRHFWVNMTSILSENRVPYVGE